MGSIQPIARFLCLMAYQPHKGCTPVDPSHRQAKAGQPARTYIQQLCVDTRCNPEDLLEAIDDREAR